MAAIWIAATTLAMGSSLDNLSIGVLYGTKGNHFTIYQNAFIASMNTIGTAIAMTAGLPRFRFLFLLYRMLRQ